jgi:hypothetical protein
MPLPSDNLVCVSHCHMIPRWVSKVLMVPHPSRWSPCMTSHRTTMAAKRTSPWAQLGDDDRYDLWKIKTRDCVYKLFQTDRILPGWYSIDLNRSFLFAMLREYRMFIHFETRMAGCSGWNSASLCYRWWTAVSSIRIDMPCRFAIHGGTWKLVHRNVQPYRDEWYEWPIRYMMIYVTLGYIGLFPTRDKFWFIITE